MSQAPAAADRVACFDLGGVVVRICRSWREGCERAGVDLREPERFENLEFLLRRHELTDAYMSGRIGCDAFFASVAEVMGRAYTPDEVRAVHNAWVLDDYPGVRELIEELNETPGVRTACLSNTNHSHWAPLVAAPDRWPAIAALQHTLVSHLLGAVKPDEEIYALAEERLGVGPDAIVFFDDLPANVEAARARGWHATLVDHAGDPARQMRGVLAEVGVL